MDLFHGNPWFTMLTMLNQNYPLGIIASLSMNKGSNGNNQDTIQTSVKGVRAKCSLPDHGRIGH
jgi:hypothetical protein